MSHCDLSHRSMVRKSVQLDSVKPLLNSRSTSNLAAVTEALSSTSKLSKFITLKSVPTQVTITVSDHQDRACICSDVAFLSDISFHARSVECRSCLELHTGVQAPEDVTVQLSSLQDLQQSTATKSEVSDDEVDTILLSRVSHGVEWWFR